MKTLRKVVPAALLLGFSATAALPQISKSGNGYLFRMKFTKGVISKYQMTATTSLPTGGSMPFSTPFSQKVLSVANGVATVEFTVGPPVVNGQAQGKPTIQTLKLDSKGKIVGGSASQQVSNITFPDKPVGIGGTWSGEMAGPGQMGAGGKLTATYKLVAVKKVGNLDVAVVSSTVKGGGSGMTITGSGESMLRLSDGSLQSSNIKMTVTMPGQNGGKPMILNSTVTVKRV